MASSNRESSIEETPPRSSRCKCPRDIERPTRQSSVKPKPCSCPFWEELVGIITPHIAKDREDKNEKSRAKRKQYAKQMELCKKRTVWPVPASGKRKKKNKYQTLNDKLAILGFPLEEYSGNCARAAIYHGKLKFEEEADLDQVILESEGMECEHKVTATLRDVLKQCDYGGDEFTENAVVFCDEIKNNDNNTEACEYGKFFVAGLCEGNPHLNWGRGHHHCVECSGFGQCVGDWTMSHCDTCGHHYYINRYRDTVCEECEIRKPSRFRIYDICQALTLDLGCRDEIPPFEEHSDSDHDEYFELHGPHSTH